MDATEAVRKEFLCIREQSIWLCKCRRIFCDLYESEGCRSTLHRSAAWFFHDLNLVLIDYIYLLIYKITDPPMTMGRENLTIPGIIQSLSEIGLYQRDNQQIEEAYSGIMAYRGLIKLARNRLIAHLDKDSVLSGNPIGEHKPEEIPKFFRNLQIFCDEIGVLLQVGPLSFVHGCPGPGDSLDLIKVLRNGLKDDRC